MLLNLLSLVGGLVGAICWLIGDIALVGYDIKHKKFKDYADALQVKHKDGAIFMLEGTSFKLYLGSIIAFFSAPLLIFSVYGLYGLTNKDLLSFISVCLILIGFTLSPPAHIAFYYCDTLSRTLHRDFLENKK